MFFVLQKEIMKKNSESYTKHLPRLSCLRMMGVANPGFLMLILYLFSLAHRSVALSGDPVVAADA